MELFPEIRPPLRWMTALYRIGKVSKCSRELPPPPPPFNSGKHIAKVTIEVVNLVVVGVGAVTLNTAFASRVELLRSHVCAAAPRTCLPIRQALKPVLSVLPAIRPEPGNTPPTARNVYRSSFTSGVLANAEATHHLVSSGRACWRKADQAARHGDLAARQAER